MLSGRTSFVSHRLPWIGSDFPVAAKGGSFATAEWLAGNAPAPDGFSAREPYEVGGAL